MHLKFNERHFGVHFQLQIIIIMNEYGSINVIIIITTIVMASRTWKIPLAKLIGSNNKFTFMHAPWSINYYLSLKLVCIHRLNGLGRRALANSCAISFSQENRRLKIQRMKVVVWVCALPSKR